MNDISSQPAPGRNSALHDFLGRKADSPRARLVRRGGLALTGLLVLWLLYHFTFGRADTSPHYATTAAHRGELLVSVSATGNLQPTNEVEVGSELSGLVTDVNVDNNDRVTRNQVLAKLDTSRLQDAIVQGQAAL